MANYRQKLFVVDAVQWIGDPKPVVNGVFDYVDDNGVSRKALRQFRGVLNSSEGGIEFLSEGEWILRGVDGSRFTCPDVLFSILFDPLP